VSRAGFDVTVPNVARIYDYFLGGKDNFAADREAAEELREVLPDAKVACLENRDFLRRAVRYLAGEAGIRQFIDIGSGLPTAENTHEVAQAVRPDARVVYVDYDPVVMTHARALLESSPNVAAVDADLRRPGAILGSTPLTDLVDFSEPVAILLVAVLHFIGNDEDPYGIAGVLKSVMAPGSYLAISHVTQDGVSREERLGGLSVYDKASAAVFPRRYDEVLKFFDRMELVDPGLVSISEWRSHVKMRQLIYGGVAWKP
jgi:S-adenosyl methyltransferase